MFINEVYFGKPKLLLEMEKCIHTIRERYDNHGNYQLFYDTFGGRGAGEIEQSAEWKRIKSIIEEEFGFYSVTFTLLRDSTPNACTLPISITYDGVIKAKQNATISKKGIRYDKSARYCTIIMITEGLFFGDFTDAEVVAILLHEIGHNFDSSFYGHLTPFTFLDLTLGVITALVFNNNISALLGAIIATTGGRRMVSTSINTLMASKFWCIVDWFSFINKMQLNLVRQLFKPVFTIMNVVKVGAYVASGLAWLNAYYIMCGSYTRENIADRFAAMYGYGPEAASADIKFDNPVGTEKILDRIPVVGSIYGLFTVAASVLFTFVDPHPVTSARVNSYISLIEHDLKNSDLDEKTKKCIREDIKKINATIKEYQEKESH